MCSAGPPTTGILVVVDFDPRSRSLGRAVAVSVGRDRRSTLHHGCVRPDRSTLPDPLAVDLAVGIFSLNDECGTAGDDKVSGHVENRPAGHREGRLSAEQKVLDSQARLRDRDSRFRQDQHRRERVVALDGRRATPDDQILPVERGVTLRQCQPADHELGPVSVLAGLARRAVLVLVHRLTRDPQNGRVDGQRVGVHADLTGVVEFVPLLAESHGRRQQGNLVGAGVHQVNGVRRERGLVDGLAEHKLNLVEAVGAPARGQDPRDPEPRRQVSPNRERIVEPVGRIATGSVGVLIHQVPGGIDDLRTDGQRVRTLGADGIEGEYIIRVRPLDAQHGPQIGAVRRRELRVLDRETRRDDRFRKAELPLEVGRRHRLSHTQALRARGVNGDLQSHRTVRIPA